MKELLHKFLPFFKLYKKEFAFAIVGMVLVAVGTAGAAYAIEPILNKIFIEKNEELLKVVPLLLVIMYFAKGSGRYIQAYYSSKIGESVIKHLRDKTLKNLLKLDMEFFVNFRKGELISRLMNDIERVRLVVANMIPEIAREALTIVALLSVVVYNSPKLAFFALVLLPVTIYPLRILARKMKKISTKSQEKMSDITSILGEIFNNIELIKISNTQNLEYKSFEAQTKKFLDVNMKAVKTNELVSPIMEVIGALGAAVVIIIGGMEVIEDKMSVGAFFSFLAALFMLYTPIKKVSKLYNRAQDAIAATNRVFNLLGNEPTILSGSEQLQNIENIKFENVDLFYDQKQVLFDINIEANKGEVIALVGNSGGGKSSLINLIVRFYEANAGQILLNDTPIQKLELSSLRHKVSLISQRVYILNDTVAANVSYGLEYDEKKVIASLEQANAIEFVNGLKQGIHTPLKEFGANLSGGQRQRIAIARAFYKDPDILIFDEATSALDNKSEKEITQALKRLEENKITFIIAHRLSTVEHATKIYVLKEGHIVGQGTNESLLKTCEEYQQLKGVLV
jgi:subfamily B ATP-binding cassette protein MsbA